MANCIECAKTGRTTFTLKTFGGEYYCTEHLREMEEEEQERKNTIECSYQETERNFRIERENTENKRKKKKNDYER